MTEFACILVVAASCAHNVPQDRATGADGRVKGAQPIKLDNGEGIARGIVTYPGGDRVDWKSIELPEGKRGTLDLKMSWTAPRPGLRVAFDVFDQYDAPIATPAVAHNRLRETSIAHARGKYFVRVFAPRRIDAGTYKLIASFEEDPPVYVVDLRELPIPDPPRLTAIPVVTTPCDVFDPKNDDCVGKCPEGAPATWKGCTDICRTPDVNNPACWRVMECPMQADRRLEKCMANPNKYFAPCPDPSKPDPANPRCDPERAEPIPGRIIHYEQVGGSVLITIDIGSASHVAEGWHVRVLRGDSDQLLPDGDATLIRVTRTQSLARVKLRTEQVDQNQNVRLTPR